MPAHALRSRVILLVLCLFAAGCDAPKPAPLSAGKANQFDPPPTMDARAATVEIQKIALATERLDLNETAQPSATPTATATPEPGAPPTAGATRISSPSRSATAELAAVNATPSAAPTVPAAATATPLPTAPAGAAWTGVPWVFTQDGGDAGMPWHAEGYNCKGVYGNWTIIETMKGTSPEGMKIDLQGELKGNVPEDGRKGQFSGTMVMMYSLGPVSGSLDAAANGTMALSGTQADPSLSVVTAQASGQATGGGPGMTLSMPFQGSSDKPYEVKIHPDPGYARCK